MTNTSSAYPGHESASSVDIAGGVIVGVVHAAGERSQFCRHTCVSAAAHPLLYAISGGRVGHATRPSAPYVQAAVRLFGFQSVFLSLVLVLTLQLLLKIGSVEWTFFNYIADLISCCSFLLLLRDLISSGINSHLSGETIQVHSSFEKKKT